MVTDEAGEEAEKAVAIRERTGDIAGDKAGMDRRRRGAIGVWRLPSELKKEYRGRSIQRGGTVQKQIEESPGLEAKTLFSPEWLQ